MSIIYNPDVSQLVTTGIYRKVGRSAGSCDVDWGAVQLVGHVDNNVHELHIFSRTTRTVLNTITSHATASASPVCNACCKYR
jgi:hypothetical protein